jgi:MFS family permease
VYFGTATITQSKAMKNPHAGPVVRFLIVLLMVLFSVMSYFDRTIMSVAGPGIIKTFGLSETQMGLVYSAFLLGYALMMVPGGHLADRFGPRRTLIIVGLGAGLFTGLTAFGARPGLGSFLGVIPALLIIRFLMGIFTAPLYPACGRMNTNWFPAERQGFVWGLVAAGAGVGSALSPSLLSWMIPSLGWRKSFGLAGVATVILTPIWALIVRDYPSEHSALQEEELGKTEVRMAETKHNAAGGGMRSLLRNRDVQLLAVGYLTVGYFEYIFFFWIYYYFGEIRHLSRGETSFYTTVIFLSWVIMSPLGGLLSDRLVKKYGSKLGRPIVPVAAMLLAAMFLLLGTLLTSLWAVGSVFALSFGLASATDGPFWKAAIEVGKEDVGAACGLMNTGGNVGGFLAPMLTPFIASFAGWTAALAFGCVIAFAGVAIWFFLGTPEPHAVTRVLSPVGD